MVSKTIFHDSKVLDLGCGLGLYTSRLSKISYDVTGVGLSSISIEYAKSIDMKTRYICNNYLTLDDLNQYDVITLIYCDYAALTKNERKYLLDKTHHLLKLNSIMMFSQILIIITRLKKQVGVFLSSAVFGIANLM